MTTPKLEIIETSGEEVSAGESHAPSGNPLAQRGGVRINSIDDAVQIVEQLRNCNLLPRDIQNGADAFMILMAGAELGMAPMASLRGLHIIKGRVTMSAELILARLLAQGVRVTWEQSTNEAAVLILQRPGFEPHREEFTIEDAARAKLLGKSDSNWAKYPRAMLRARCISAGARAYAPDMMAGGGVYTPEELDGIEGHAPKVLSEVAQDARADNPEKFDASKAEQADEVQRDAEWFASQKADLDEMASAAKRFYKEGAPPEEAAALWASFDEWLSIHALDFLHLTYGKSPRNKAWGRIGWIAKGCDACDDGARVENLKAMIKGHALNIEAQNGDVE